MEYSCRHCKYRLSEDCMEDEMRRKCGRFRLDESTLNIWERKELKKLNGKQS